MPQRSPAAAASTANSEVTRRTLVRDASRAIVEAGALTATIVIDSNADHALARRSCAELRSARPSGAEHGFRVGAGGTPFFTPSRPTQPTY